MKIKKGYKYQLVEEPFMFKLPIQPGQPPQGEECWKVPPFIVLWPDGQCYVEIGFAYNGASGPTIDTDNTIVPTLKHDVGYLLIAEGILPEDPWRELFDKELYKDLLERGMDETRAKIWFEAVRAFGLEAATTKDEVYEYF